MSTFVASASIASSKARGGHVRLKRHRMPSHHLERRVVGHGNTKEMQVRRRTIRSAYMC
jgi:hypothetical protein